MALTKTLVHRLLNITKTPKDRTFSPSNASSFLQRLLSCSNPVEDGLSRRFLHQNTTIPAGRLGLPTGEKLMEKLRELNGERIRLDALSDPIPPDRGVTMTVEQARKVLRVSEMEGVKARLRGVKKSSISYSDFVQICREGSSFERGVGIAKSLDESGAVLVLGNAVFLRPEQVARAIESVIPISKITTNNNNAEEKEAVRHELKAMEEEKAAIDQKADALVKRELWCGLAFLVVQTAGFMRLTFWELSWDVMEPICFYVTSIYFMAGYAFFLRTSKDPSFEGFFESRFASRQKQLMNKANFDLRRFHQLRQESGRRNPTACLELDSCGSSPSGLGLGLGSNYCGCHRRDALAGVVH